jgi:hypothetical protein
MNINGGFPPIKFCSKKDDDNKNIAVSNINNKSKHIKKVNINNILKNNTKFIITENKDLGLDIVDEL